VADAVMGRTSFFGLRVDVFSSLVAGVSAITLRRLLLTSTMIFGALPGWADTPSSSVTTTSVNAGTGSSSDWPEVPANGEGWFDVGGFCKVVDVGNLNNLSASDRGVPVWVDGGIQWQRYRNNAGTHFNGDVTLTTCGRPKTNIANLCTAAGATPVPVSRQYGKLGETDTVSAVCTDQWGEQYTDIVSVTVAVVGMDGPDGQAQWQAVGSDSTGGCTADAYDTGCSAACGSTSTGTRFDSCGNPTNYSCSGGACPPPAPTPAPTPTPPPSGTPSPAPIPPVVSPPGDTTPIPSPPPAPPPGDTTPIPSPPPFTPTPPPAPAPAPPDFTCGDNGGFNPGSCPDGYHCQAYRNGGLWTYSCDEGDSSL